MGRVIRVFVLLEESKRQLSLVIPNSPVIVTLYTSKVLPISHSAQENFS